MVLFRLAFAVHGVVLLVLAAVLGSPVRESVLARLAFSAALVLYIVAVGALLVTHHSSRRSLFELLAFAVYPVLVYGVAYRALPWAGGDLWVYLGRFHFLAVAGGFLLGLFTAPLVALWRGAGEAEVGEAVEGGLRHSARQGGVLNAVVALGLALGALGFFFARFATGAPGSTAVQKLVLLAGFLVAAGLVVAFTWTTTVFARPGGDRKAA